MAAKKSTTRTIKPKRKGQKPISFKSNGSLKRALPKNKNGTINMAAARKASEGKGKTAAKARLYVNVLSKGRKK